MIKLTTTFCALICLFSFGCLAQADEFIVTANIFLNDNTPPTTPNITSAVPISSDQVDVAWSLATDNISVAGYRIYRDGLFIATTTLNNFSDTGLSASTTYAYTVEAFDQSGNVSTTSAAVSVTTLAIPDPNNNNNNNNSSQSTITKPALTALTIDPSRNAAVLDFSSERPTRYILRYGRTTSYELGTISNSVFTTNHSSTLAPLEPSTTYYIELVFYNGAGVSQVVATQSFTTDPAIMSAMPASVSNLQGQVQGQNAALSWTNPLEAWQKIRLVRSHLFYPQSITDGVVVYEGTGNNFTDQSVFGPQDGYYYSVFVTTEDGRVSAPAVVFLSSADTTGTGTGTGGDGSEAGQGDGAGSTDGGQPSDDYGDVYILLPSDVYVTFDKITYTLDSVPAIPTNSTVLVTVPFSAVPKHLKTILLSVHHPTNHKQITTYLLKLRGDSTVYEAMFDASSVVGEGPVQLEVFDYEKQSVRRLSRSFNYVSGSSEPWGSPLPEIFKSIPVYVWLLVLAAAGGWWLVARRRQREDNR